MDACVNNRAVTTQQKPGLCSFCRFDSVLSFKGPGSLRQKKQRKTKRSVCGVNKHIRFPEAGEAITPSQSSSAVQKVLLPV